MMSIVVCCDRNYVLPLACVTSSISATQNSRVDLYVVQDGITADDRHRIQSTVSSEIRWLDVDAAMFEGISTPAHLPASALFRLLIPGLLPNLSRVIYLDTDTVVVGDLEPLWQLDLGESVIGAVHDPFVDVLGGAPGLPFAQRGLTSSTKYFNSGVMLMDLDRWRLADVSEDALSLLRMSTLAYADQCALNLVLAHRWSRISTRYNLQPAHLDNLHWVSSSQECTELARALESPTIHHFVGAKPWNPGGASVPRANLWFETLDQTVFAGWRPARPQPETSPTAMRSKIKRLSKWLRRRLVHAAQPAAERLGIRVELAERSPGLHAQRERDRIWADAEGTVTDGPFTGFRLPASARQRAGAIPAVTGTYEPGLTKVLLEETSSDDGVLIASGDLAWFLGPAIAYAQGSAVTVVGSGPDRELVSALAARNGATASVMFENRATEAIQRCAGRQVWLLNHDDLAEIMSDDGAAASRANAVLIVPIGDTRRGSSSLIPCTLLKLVEPTHRIEIIELSGRDPSQSAFGRAAPEPECWLLASEWEGRRRSGWIHLVPKRP